MKIRSRFLFLGALALGAILFGGGCERTDNSPFTAEVDDADYRRAKELLRQGRDQEALSEFQKVIEHRGLNNAPESHLELGLLYQNHMHDPIAAIYHYRRYRELKPNSPQADLVRQRIDAATRDFARTLPAQPMENMERFDMSDVVQRLRQENEDLKAQNARLKATLSDRKRPDAGLASDEAMTETSGPAHAPAGESPISAGPTDNESAAPSSETETAENLTPSSRVSAPVRAPTPAPVATNALPSRTNASSTPAATNGGHRHTIVKGDTLYSLAQHYYGSRSKWRQIFEANRDILKSKDDPLRLGMELKIP